MKETLYDCYVLLVPHKTKVTSVLDNCCPFNEVFIVSSPKDFGKIEFALQGEKLEQKKREALARFYK